MTSSTIRLRLAVAVLLVSSCDSPSLDRVAGALHTEAIASSDAPLEIRQLKLRKTRSRCGEVAEGGTARCFVEVAAEDDGRIVPNAGPVFGLSPTQLASAYNLPSSGGSGLTVAIVDAYDNPNAEADLAVYRAQYGLSACTTANGCFRKINQNGATSPLPALDTGWAGEISLDLQAVSAVCPSCKLLLIEADSASVNNLSFSARRR